MRKENFLFESALDSQQGVQFLENKIYEHNSVAIGRHDGKIFCKVVRDRDGNIIAGIGGWTWDDVSEITQLWVDESVRRNGLGKVLLQLAEIEARKRGCHTVFVRSYSFQAPHFYVKFGFNIEHIISDFPLGHNYWLLLKKLVET